MLGDAAIHRRVQDLQRQLHLVPQRLTDVDHRPDRLRGQILVRSLPQYDDLSAGQLTRPLRPYDVIQLPRMTWQPHIRVRVHQLSAERLKHVRTQLTPNHRVLGQVRRTAELSQPPTYG